MGVWASDDSGVTWRKTAELGPVVSVAFNADGQRLASGSWDQSAIVWDLTEQHADNN